MLLLVISILCMLPDMGELFKRVEVSIPPPFEFEVFRGKPFNVSCEFTFLTPRHTMQLCKEHGTMHENCLIKENYTTSNKTLQWIVESANRTHSGNYTCKTSPPEAISSSVIVRIKEGQKVMETTPGYEPKDTTIMKVHPQQDLQGQMWFWMLVGKTSILVVSLVGLIVKYKSE